MAFKTNLKQQAAVDSDDTHLHTPWHFRTSPQGQTRPRNRSGNRRNSSSLQNGHFIKFKNKFSYSSAKTRAIQMCTVQNEGLCRIE